MRSRFLLLTFTIIICLETFGQVGSRALSEVVVTKMVVRGKDIPGSVVALDIDDLNGNPDMVVIAKKDKTITDTNIKRDPNPFNIKFNHETGHFELIYARAKETFEEGDKLNILYTPVDTPSSAKGNFIHHASVGTFNSGVDYATVMDYPLTNGDSQWRFIVGMWLGVEGEVHDQIVNPYYDFFGTKEWVLKSKPGFEITLDSKFAVIGNTASLYKYTHTSNSENIGKVLNSADQFSFYTELGHADIDGNSDMVVVVEPIVATGSSFQEFLFESSTYYNFDTNKWELHLELETFPGSDYNFPIGIDFNVFASAETLSVDSIFREHISVFPNPVSTVFTIETKRRMDKVSIYNVLGKKIIDFPEVYKNKLHIDVSSFKPGYYFTQIETKGSVETYKMLKI